jgi:methionyl-tRNA synthetase
MLMALGIELPKMVYGHGWLVIEGDKMSKSKGNVVEPLALIDEFGADAIRYFLLREITLGLDGNFSRDALIHRINSDLANDIGNLLHRTLNMIGRFNDGKIPAASESEPIDDELIKMARNTVASYEAAMEKLDINSAIKDVWALIGRSNKYIDETAPWALAKDPAKKARLDTVLYNLAETLRIVAVLISPYMPNTAPKIWAQLGIAENFAEVRLSDAQTWGGLKPGIAVAKPEPLFPRIEDKPEEKAEEKAEAKSAAPAPAAVEAKPEVTIDEFAKMDLRVAKVLAAEKVKGADKLLLLTVDLGSEQRTIVSGIAKHYEPESLVGRDVVMIVNLKPAKIRGIESRGMVLAASSDDGKLSLVTAPDMPAGSKVK